MSARNFHVTCKGEMKMTHVSDFGQKQDIPEQKLVLVNDASILDVASVECVWNIQVEMFRKVFEIQS